MNMKPGYKRTQIGVVPEDWEVKCLGEIGEALIGLTYSPVDVSFDGLLVLRSSNIVDGRLSYEDNVFVQTEVPERIIVREGDILICVRNGSRALIGKCAKIDKHAEGMTFGAFMAVFRTDLHDYVFYQFQSSIIERQIHAHLGATINQITNASLNSFLIPLPPTLAEQQAIAEVLSDVDALISALDQLITKKRAIKQGAMQELLTGRRRLPGFSGEWEIRQLGDMADTDPENLGSETHSDYAFNYITLEDVVVGTLRSYSEQVFRSAPSRARRKLHARDVLVSTVRPMLMSHLLFLEDGEDWICSTGFCVVRCRDSVSHPGYVYYHLFSEVVGRQIDALLTGSNYPAINGADVRALHIPFPGYVEQTAIAAVLSDMDAEIAALERRRDKTKLLKQGMMQELLTGRTRLI